MEQQQAKAARPPRRGFALPGASTPATRPISALAAFARRPAPALAALALSSLAGLSQAQEVTVSALQGQIERATQNITALGADLMGDKVNLYTGALEFVHTDVSLPGNDALAVAVGRRHVAGRDPIIEGQFGDWDLEIPHLHGVFAGHPGNQGWVNGAGTTARCSNFTAPPYVVGARQTYIHSSEYWQGNFLYLPGAGSQELLRRGAANSAAPADGNSYPIVTREHWQLRCLPALANGAGEGFEALSPDGTRYRFDWIAARKQPLLKAGPAGLARNEVWLMPTVVTDRHGNTVSYRYDSANPWRLTQIQASDGRTIDLTHTTVNGRSRIQAVSDGSRTWTYGYNSQADLERVTLPDGSSWRFALRGLVYPDRLALGEDARCEFQGGWPGDLISGTLTHPSNATGTFVTGYVSHSRTDVAKACFAYSHESDFARWPRTFVSQSLLRKTLEGPGLAPLTWNFAYQSGPGSWSPCWNCGDNKTVQVTDPQGHVTRHVFGIRFNVNEGQLLQTDEGWDGSTALRSTRYRYRQPAGAPYPEPVGTSPQNPYNGEYLAGRHRPQDQRVITQQGTTFTWEATAFDALARPVSVTRSSSLGYSRGETTAYYDHAGKWVLGQIASITEGSTGLAMESHGYDAGSALRTASYRFGRLLNRSAYNADGTLQASYDPLGRATVFSSHKRGLAQRVDYPDGSSESAVVNDLGQITALTNAAGSTTGYGYDAMGRLARITPPGGDAVAYHPTTQVFEPVAAVEYGLAAGHWRHTVATGNGRTVRYYDGLWRPLLTRTWDAADEAGSSRMVQARYDEAGRKSFESYPQRTIGSVSQGVAGTAWTHDALGRVTRQVQDSELGPLSTGTEYLDGFIRRVTNPRGQASSYAYQAFDTPGEDALATVWAPEGLTVGISRDVWGKPLAITRSGSYGGGTVSATRGYVYDAHQRLCKTVEPETGATVQAYDGAGNVAWRASGLNLPGGGCDQEGVPEGRKISHGYDAMGRLTSTTYGDGSPGITRGYTADGLLAQVSSAGSTWSYGYNRRRLKVQESLAHGGTAYTFEWGVDAHGKVASLAYPGGPVLQYSPNALGEATQVSGYAGGITYHPNGAVAGYQLANGVAHSVSQNLRGLPQQWRDAGVVQDEYSFDANGNVTGIADQQEGVSSRTMGYDGLDRLTAANGVWGAAGYGYDPLDNLRASTVGGRSLSHNLDPATHRLASLSGSQNIGFGYDANGNVTSRGAQAYRFDIGNRLQSAVGKAEYSYDGLGRRVRVGYADGQVKVQVYSQAGQLLMSNHSSQGLTRHVYLGDKLIAETNSLTGTSYSHTDALGSPVARTNTGGQVLSRTRYEPYGATAAGTNPDGIGFTGHVNDPDTGLVQMQQRYYDPLAGRFLSVDPVVTDAETGEHFTGIHMRTTIRIDTLTRMGVIPCFLALWWLQCASLRLRPAGLSVSPRLQPRRKAQ